MGRFSYEATMKTEFEDRLLAHLQHVIGTKLRRGESFYFTWRDEASIGNGRVSVWMHPQSNIMFKFHGSRAPSLNHAWLQALTRAANSPQGLYIMHEPEESAYEQQPESAMTFRMVPEDAPIPAP